MSAYWIYEDMTEYLAMAHRADCRYCNNGAGTGRGRDERASRWLGPYNSEGEIRSAPIRADSTLRKCKVRPCRDDPVLGRLG
jgi:hypothetical protein